jgi:parvulin-like peptidyl-prolyl isomerase
MKTLNLKKIKPKLPTALPYVLRRPKATEERVTEALKGVPRITNETVAEHREAVLSSARKYIYPLKHSKHRVVRTSILLLVIALVVFMGYCGAALYKFQTTSEFIYDVSRVIPFPVAKIGNNYISYESYLFELRRNIHYYQTQQEVDFSSKDGKVQLKLLKEQAMDQVLLNGYIQQLANKYGISVSDSTVNDEVLLVRSENRLGSGNRDFNEVLSEFWGWNQADFKRELKEQLLQQAVVAHLDMTTEHRAQSALNQLKQGTDFAALASQVSDDLATKGNGGAYPTAITSDDTSLAPAITAELFQLKPGQISGIINTGYTLEILKVLDRTQTSVHAAHIQFTFKPITVFVKPLESKNKSHTYIKV